MATFSSNVLQWIIYDSYQDDYDAQQLEKELERERKEQGKMGGGKPAAQPKKDVSKSQVNEIMQARIVESWKVLERMINQNTYDDIAKGKFFYIN